MPLNENHGVITDHERCVRREGAGAFLLKAERMLRVN